jgi:uncharacterized protein
VTTEAALLAGAGTLAGASVQAATGFGFALVASPAAFAALGAEEAVVAILALGVVLNSQILAMGGAGAVLRSEVARVLAAAVPGAIAGALVLGAVPDSALQIAVGALAIVAVLLQELRKLGTVAREPGSWPLGSAYPTGLLSGALTTTTTINGPPLVVWLRGRRASLAATRASLAATFVGLGAVGGAALAISGDLIDAFDPGAIALLIPAALIGGVAGKRLTDAASEAALERLMLVLVLAAGVAAIAAGLA